MIITKGNQIQVSSSYSCYISHCISPVDLIMSLEVSVLKRNSFCWLAVYLAFLFWNQTHSSSSSLFMWHSIYYVQGKIQNQSTCKLMPPLLSLQIQSLLRNTVQSGTWLWSCLLMLCDMILHQIREGPKNVEYFELDSLVLPQGNFLVWISADCSCVNIWTSSQ